MRFLIVLLLALPLMTEARENPFAPATEDEKSVEKEAIIVKQETEEVEATNIDPMPVEIETVTEVSQEEEPSTDAKKEVVNYAVARFVFRENSAYIETKDEVLRHFAVSSPPSIVVDFKAAADFASKRKELTVKPFKKVEMGAHGDLYRVVLRLDKKHRYKIESAQYGQLITILD